MGKSRIQKNDMNKCLQCVYRGKVPYSRHSSCHHPYVDEIIGNHDYLLDLLSSIVNDCRIPNFSGSFQVKIKDSAVAEGWGTWPFNFDPVWLIKCTGFKALPQYKDKNVFVYEHTKTVNHGNGNVELISERVEEDLDDNRND